jgi:HlyD family secretion protein
MPSYFLAPSKVTRAVVNWKSAFWLLALAMGIFGYWASQKIPQANSEQKYKTEALDRGTVIQVITANGTINPVVLVNVGTQISGTIQKLHANFNDQVTQGQVLAELDPSLLNAQLGQSTANLASAQANLRLAQAKEARTRTLVGKGFVVRSQLDDAVKELDAARAQVQQAKAQIEKDQANLHYSIIRSPVSGVVVARSVDTGQTVAASFQTPTLFQIAQDLKVMQIDTSIAEADIGKIRVGQEVNFTVDTFAERAFKGNVKQVRLNPTIQQNVVTYNVVVAADNSEGLLMPGMTAHVLINTERRENTLRVPNAALRFKPNPEDDNKAGGAKVYVLSGGKPREAPLKTGIADNAYTEVVSGEVKEGDAVVIREIGKKKDMENRPFRLRAF